MRDVALFVPCYVDQLFPRVAWASVALLEHHGWRVRFGPDPTCCGQLHLNAGDPERARSLARRFARAFAGAGHVVAPSASCVATVRRHYAGLLGASPELDALVARTRELCEFLVEVAGVRRIAGRLPARVALHPSCHGLRELHHGRASERGGAGGSAGGGDGADGAGGSAGGGDGPDGEGSDPARTLLASLEAIELVSPARPDECCGFGGSFAVSEAAVSCAMGRDRVRAQLAAGAGIVTSSDVSCLAHLGGIARREGARLRTVHVAELLAEAMGAEGFAGAARPGGAPEAGRA